MSPIADQLALVKGTLDVLVLKALSWGPMHGFEITTWLEENSGGALKGNVYILRYQTRFERGEGMETFTLVEQNGRWLLARYLVNSTALG